ncbi:hypothetical protein GWK47_000376 [Chionoecetes opilio]|uniref:Uncharacterized protein n=1 Tax=Chionoecetes opilio TaxID=41210 RepID=A0A8J4YP59_CHIOP|nr:hypothetical protein GWK47_000376 [Chionoecetes opilio]
MARHIGTSPRARPASSLFDEATVVEESGHRQRHAAAAGGEEPASPPPTSPSTQWSSAPLASFATTNSVGLVTALGPVTISSTSIRPSGRGGTTTPRLVGAPVPPTVVNDFGGEGGRPHQRVLRRHHARQEQRQHLLQVVERHRALYPCAK